LISEKIPEEKRRFTENENRIEIPPEVSNKGQKHIEAAVPMGLLKLDIVRWVPTMSTQFLFKRVLWSEDKKHAYILSNPTNQILAYAYKMLCDEKYLEFNKVKK
jgi:hypothetical protein